MKTPRFLLLILTALFAVLTPRPAEARVEASFDFFYDSLTPYGEWVQVADYGFCWRPTDVDPDWAPYSDGYWAYTDAGWTWVSYEDFGGIVYHYGRWVRVEDEGWCWTPDYEWGPAWVSWRHSDDYVGWAPLPPECHWQPSTGISIWVDRDYDIGPSYYSFCHVRDFGAPVLRPVIINRIENFTIIRRTVNITNITYNTRYSGGPVIFNSGPNFASINQRSARRIPALKLVQNTNIDLAGMRDTPRGDRRRNFNGQAVGNQLVVTAPFVKPLADPGLLKPQVKKVFAADKVSRGWNGVKNDDVRKELKQEMQRQTKGLTRETAPARAVAVNDLKVLPAKADPQAPSPLATRDQADRPDKGDKNDKNDKDRPDKKGKTPPVAGQPSGPADGTDVRTKPGPQPVTTPDSEDKTTPGKPRGPVARDGQKPGEPGLKPFNPVNPVNPPNPVAETDQQPPKGKGKGKDKDSGAPGTATTPEPRVAKPGPDATKMRDAEQQQQQQQQQQRQAEMIRQQQEKQKAAQAAQAEQDKTRKQAEAAAKIQQQQDAQREALRQQQKEKDDGARQRMQAEQQERANRQQAAAAAQQQKQAEMQRRQADEQKAADQQQKAADQQTRRAAMEQQRQQKEAGEQQRQQKEANEQARRNQDAQRDQMRQQAEAQRQAREAQKAQQQQQNTPPAGSTDSEDPRKKKKKD